MRQTSPHEAETRTQGAETGRQGQISEGSKATVGNTRKYCPHNMEVGSCRSCDIIQWSIATSEAQGKHGVRLSLR